MKSQKTTNKVKYHLLEVRRNEKVITGIKRISNLVCVSTPNQRPTYSIKRLRIAIISTSNGVVTDKQARRWSVAEVLAYVCNLLIIKITRNKKEGVRSPVSRGR